VRFVLAEDRTGSALRVAPLDGNGYGPRGAESGLGLVVGHLYSAPYEDLKLKGK
jgi:hypothetical protein